MEKPPVVTMPESTPQSEKQNVDMERKVKIQIITDKALRNLLKFLRLTMEVACSNHHPLTS